MITLPAIRRALQRLLAPVSRHDCGYCRPWLTHGKQKLTRFSHQGNGIGLPCVS